MTTGSSERKSGRQFVTPLYMESTLNPINSPMIATALAPIAGSGPPTGPPINRHEQGELMTDSLPAITPQHTALLVMDYQPAILGSLSEAEALLSRVADAIAVVRRHGGQIGYVRVAFEDAEYDAVPAHSRMAARIAAAGS